MSEWTTDLKQARPGWLVEQDCVGCFQGTKGGTYNVTKVGVVVEVLDHKFSARLTALLGDEELWWLSYSDKNVRVREP